LKELIEKNKDNLNEEVDISDILFEEGEEQKIYDMIHGSINKSKKSKMGKNLTDHIE
jgi:hypothetical protein